MDRTYVALDLETTGLDPKNDKIIEVGAVKFDHDRILETYETLVNPACAIPLRIQALCGLKQGEFDGAPSFPDIAPALATFIGGHPIVGHNISFDLDFLAHQGLSLPNVTFDTWELSTLLLFRQTDYSLSALTRELSLFPPEHRALADARASRDLFVTLYERALSLDLATLQALIKLAETADLGLVHFFRQALNIRGRTAFAPHPPPERPEPARDSSPRLKPRLASEVKPLDEDFLASILEPGGLLSTCLPGYEHRPTQIEMMRSVTQALNRGGQLIVEAGTGTGKSIAYLLPCMIFALQNEVTVVISTNTINLQEQLITKDIPDLAKALHGLREFPIGKLRIAQLKGRSNYLCLRKYESLKSGGRLSTELARLLARVMVWLPSTETGDRGELNLNFTEVPAWTKICAELDERVEKQCPRRLNDSCFLYRARRAAEQAHLIIVNHALLLSDLVSEGNLLPEYKYLIIDEAHHLEDEATTQLGSEITEWDLVSHLSHFNYDGDDARPGGLITLVHDVLRGSRTAKSRQSEVRELADSMSTLIDRSRKDLTRFMDTVRHFIEVHSPDQSEYNRNLLLSPQKRVQPGWSRVEITWDSLNSSLREVEDYLDRLYSSLESLDSGAGHEHLMVELAFHFARNRELRTSLDSLVTCPNGEDIYWLLQDVRANSTSLRSAPLDVSKVLEDSLFASKESVVLTGATLSARGDLAHLKNRLGLPEASELQVGSPFDYPGSAMIYLPSDMPDPGSATYQHTLGQAVIQLGRACEGRTLVLFTSHASLKATQAAIQAPLEQDGILVLAQGIDGSPKQLVTAFKANPKAVLLGAASFWEGIDIVGEALSVVAMARLPFNVPTEPVFSARSQLFDDPFNDYAIPQAAIRFKQAFGRLIRSKTDRGILVVFDRRVQSKKYGAAFLESIPECTVVRDTVARLPYRAAKWIAGPVTAKEAAGDIGF